MQKATWIREVLKWVDLKVVRERGKATFNFMNMRKLLASRRCVKQVAVITYSADLSSIFQGCDYMFFFFPKYLAMQWERGGKTGCFLIFTNTNSGWQYLKRLELVIYGWQVKMLEKWTIETGYMSILFWMVSSLVVMLILNKIEKHQ